MCSDVPTAKRVESPVGGAVNRDQGPYRLTVGGEDLTSTERDTMANASILHTSPRHRSAPAVLEGDRPDVAVIIDTADPPDCVLRVAGLHAASEGGVLHVVQVLDAQESRSSAADSRRTSTARSHLGRVVERYGAKQAGVPVTERLHFGSLRTLLNTLESSVGTVVVEAAADDTWRRQVASLSPVPVWVVDRTGSVISSS